MNVKMLLILYVTQIRINENSSIGNFPQYLMSIGFGTKQATNIITWTNDDLSITHIRITNYQDLMSETCIRILSKILTVMLIALYLYIENITSLPCQICNIKETRDRVAILFPNSKQNEVLLIQYDSLIKINQNEAVLRKSLCVYCWHLFVM